MTLYDRNGRITYSTEHLLIGAQGDQVRVRVGARAAALRESPLGITLVVTARLLYGFWRAVTSWRSCASSA